MPDDSQTTVADLPPTKRVLLDEALNDARNAVSAMEQGDWLRADILLKLAVDTLADTGIIP